MICELIKTRLKCMNNLDSSSTTLFVETVAEKMISALHNKKHIFICGNGGSASQASHFVAELTVRYKTPNHFMAISLCADYAVMTASSNDFSFDDAFAMQVKNFGQKNDLLIVLTTSGNSQNIINALRVAKEIGVESVAFLGCDGGNVSQLAETNYIVESFDTAIIQEQHLILIHLICERLHLLNA